MRKLKTIAVAFLFLFSLLFVVFNVSQVHAVGSTYYVATTGNDATGDGSIGNPWKTIQKALNTTGTDDTVYVRGGVYYGGTFDATHGFRILDDGLSLMGYPGETAILDGSLLTLASGYGFINLGTSTTPRDNVRISNLVIRNVNREGISGFGITAANDGIRIDNCTIDNIAYRGIKLWSEYSAGVATPITDVIIENCTINNTQTSLSTGEGVTLYGVNGFSIHHNVFSNCPKIMLDTANNSRNGLIFKNTFITTVDKGIKLDGSQVTTGTPAYDYNISIFDNLFYGTGYGITVGAEKLGGCHNISIYNNVFNLTNATTAITGIKLAMTSSYVNRLDNITIKHNTIVTSGIAATRPLLIEMFEERANNIYVTNNIFQGSGGCLYQVSSSQCNLSDGCFNFYNNCYNHSSQAANTFWNGLQNQFEATAVIASPQFVDRAGGDFNLNQTSPAIDAGNETYVATVDYDGNPRPFGYGYDIGAYEYDDPFVINITSDVDFNINHGVRYGSGTAANPYVICNWTIYNVSISGTTKNVTIKNCTILHHVLLSGLSASSNVLFDTVTMDGVGHIPLSYIYLTHTLSTFTNSKFYNLSYSYMKNG